MNDSSKEVSTSDGGVPSGEPACRRVNGKDVYDWALYELSCTRRVEQFSGIDTSDLRQQIVVALQKDLYEWLGEDLTI